MNNNTTGYWNTKKGRLKQKFTGLTDNDLLLYTGKEKEMIEILCYKLHMTKDELCAIIEAL